MIDWELVLIFAFVLTLLVIVLSFGTIAGKRSREHKLQALEIKARIEEAKAAQVRQQSDNDLMLEDRLRVLERIVTDPSNDLSRQIEELRELRAEGEKVK